LFYFLSVVILSEGNAFASSWADISCCFSKGALLPFSLTLTVSLEFSLAFQQNGPPCFVVFGPIVCYYNLVVMNNLFPGLVLPVVEEFNRTYWALTGG